MKKLFVFLAALALIGCASVPMADVKQDTAAKTFTAPKDKAGIYIYRNETFGSAIKMDVLLNNKLLAQTGPKTFIYTEIEPGKHTIKSVAESTDTLEFEAKAGTLTYIWQEVKLGIMMARSLLQIVTESEGKKGVNESKRILTQ